jgi:hypothetical protein
MAEGQSTRGPGNAGSLRNIYLLSALIGLASVALRVYLGIGTLATVIGWLLFAALLVLIVVGVVQVTRAGGRAPLRVSLVGVIYGVVTGAGDIVVPISASTLRAALEKEAQRLPALTQALIEKAVQREMTLGAHITAAIEAVVLFWLIALLAAWIVSLFVKRPGSSSSV